MAAITPYLDEAEYDLLYEPAGIVSTAEGAMRVSRPPFDSEAAHEAALTNATRKYADIVRRVSYPYGSDPFLPRSPEADRIPKPPKKLRDKLWKRAYKKAYKKQFGEKPARGTLPKRPKFKNLRGAGTFTYGHGIKARGITARGVGGGALGTIAGLVAPLLVKGAIAAAPFILKGIYNAIKKRRDKKKSGQGFASDLQDDASAKGAGKTPTPYQIERTKEAADAASKKGLVGMPNPLAFPPYPPSLMDENMPYSALYFWRKMYDDVKRGLLSFAQAVKMPPKYAAPYVDKFIKAQATKAFGKGGAKAILDSNIQGKPLKKLTPFHLLYPIMKLSVAKEGRKKLRELLKGRFTSGNGASGGSLAGEALAHLAKYLKDSYDSRFGYISPSLRAGARAVKESLEPFTSELPHAREELAKLGRYAKSGKPLRDIESAATRVYNAIVERLPAFINVRLHAGDTARSIRDRLRYAKDYLIGMFHSLLDPTMPSDDRPEPEYEWPEGSYAEYEVPVSARPPGVGADVVARGGSFWSSLKTLGSVAMEIGAPLIGAMLGERYGGDSDLLKKAFQVSGRVASNAIGDARLVESVRKAQDEAIARLEAKKKELDAAAANAPELYIALQKEIDRLRSGKSSKISKYALPASYETDTAITKYDPMAIFDPIMKRRRSGDRYSDLFDTEIYKTKKMKKKKQLAKLRARARELEAVNELTRYLSPEEIKQEAWLYESGLHDKYLKKGKRKNLSQADLAKYITRKTTKHRLGWSSAMKKARAKEARLPESLFTEEELESPFYVDEELQPAPPRSSSTLKPSALAHGKKKFAKKQLLFPVGQGNGGVVAYSRPKPVFLSHDGTGRVAHAGAVLALAKKITRKT